jgi:predicted pyridoxine 5'-phosphate oxidase superfamily flavin-nucleotide-binding protein
MAGRYLETHFTPEVLAAQEHYYGRPQLIPPQPERDPLTPEETEFIAHRDSFYMATVTSNGWPYMQHRGGPVGFLKVIDPQTLGFADFKGNRQLLSTGNLAAIDRVSLFLMDYPRRERLKILGHARVLDARDRRDLTDQLSPAPELRGKIERLFLIDVVSFDWNCSQYIIPRYTEEEVRQIVEPLKARVTELERALENTTGNQRRAG